eukprot:IDg16909t1
MAMQIVSEQRMILTLMSTQRFCVGADAAMPKSAAGMPNLEFKQLNMLNCWQELETSDDRVSVAVLLPSGISENADDIEFEFIVAAVR